MSVKKSVMLTDQAVGIMREHTRDEYQIPWSALVNRGIIVSDYLAKCELPDLSNAEWEAILNTYAGSIQFLDAPPYRIASDMMDDLGIINVTDHPSAELVNRIHEMSQPQQFAILDFVEKFWSADWANCADFDEIKERITSAKTSNRGQ